MEKSIYSYKFSHCLVVDAYFSMAFILKCCVEPIFLVF